MEEYSLNKTLWKGLQIFLVGGLGALGAYFTGLPPEPVIVLAIAIVQMAKNFLKNYR